MEAERELKIKETQYNGQTYKNLVLKTKIEKATGNIDQGLAVGEYAVFTKKFAEGRETKYGFSTQVEYKGDSVSFFMNEKEHESYCAAGGVDDEIIVRLVPYEYTWSGEKKTTTKLVFEKA